MEQSNSTLDGLRPLTADDEGWFLPLNEQFAVELSSLDPERFAFMRREAFRAVTIPGDCYLFAFDETSAYDSPNFIWFKERYPRFVYVDRVLVAPHARGRGLARALYEYIFAACRDSGRALITCEVNADPPNPASDAFHAAMGFKEVGLAPLPGSYKTVRYMAREL